MKTQEQLNSQNEVVKALATILLAQVNNGGVLENALMKQLTGKTHGGYGDTSFFRTLETVRDAIEALKRDVRDIAEARTPEEAEISTEALEYLEAAAASTTGARTYQILSDRGQGQIAQFKANSINEARSFAQRFGFGKVKRLTRSEARSSNLAYACSPSSEAYWSQ